MNLIEHVYEADGLRMTGFFADGSAKGSKAPGILIAHEAPGLGAQMKSRAEMLAEQGYVAFALDMYGRTGLRLEEAREESKHLMSDAGIMRRRARAALTSLSEHPHCDPAKLAAIGFCQGGVVALELARDQAPIQCAVGFHPGLKKPTGSTTQQIHAKVLMMIGNDDPIVPQEDRTAFEEDMRRASADWQLHIFGGVGHSYTNLEIDSYSFPGFAYNAQADRRAWTAMLALFDEVFQ
jgi:dienelactone hydrolase